MKPRIPNFIRIVLFFIISFLFIDPANSQTIWLEDFNDLSDGTTSDAGPTAWTRDVTACTLTAGDLFEVNNQKFEASNTDGEGIWTSEVIDISGYPSVQIDIDISENGHLENTDYIKMYYKIDGGSELLFYEQANDFGSDVATALNLSGNTLQIIIKIYNNAANEHHYIDNVTVSALTATSYYSIADGNWNNGNTWSNTSGGAPCGCVPDATGNVYIENGYTVNMNVDGNAMNVNIAPGSTLLWTAGNDLNINNNGNINIASGGNLNGNGIADARIIFRTNNGNFCLINNGSLSIDDIYLYNDNGSIIISGNSDLNINDELRFFANDVSVTNNNTAIINITDDLYFDSDNCTITNNGTINVGDDLFAGNQHNNNTLTNNASATITFGGDFNFNNSNITVENYGTLNLIGTFRNNEIDRGSNFYNYAGGTWNYGGTTFDPSTRLWCNFNANTFNYNRGGNQNIITPRDAYWNLTLSNSGIKQVQNNLDINGNVLISDAAALDPDTRNRDLTVAGNWSNTSSLGTASFDEGTETVTFDGAGAQFISNASGETFYNIIINKTAGTIITANNDITVSNLLTMTEGIFDIQTNTLGGSGGLTATGGDLRLAKTSVTLPELTGTYNITGGTITLNGAGDQTIKSLNGTPAGSNYWNLVLDGSGTKSLENNVDINGNLIIQSGITLEVTASDYSINLAGNWNNNGGTFHENNGTVNFDGDGNSTIVNTAGEVFYNLSVSKNSSDLNVTLNNDVTVTNVATFNSGHVISSTSALFIMDTGSSVGAVSDNSHVSGPVQKLTNTTTYFEFPIGDGSYYRPVGVTPASGTNTYQAQYFLAKQTLGNPVSVDHISASEYWAIERIAGTANATITLSWNSNSTVDDLGTLLVANWNGSDWISQCPCTTTGTTTAGTITSSTIDFSTSKYFTLGSSSPLTNPLSNERYSVVGGTGNWNDPNSWAYTSGGTPGAPVPTSTSIVYIEGGDVIVMNSSPGYCRSLTIGTSTAGTLRFNNNGRDLYVGNLGITINNNGDIAGTSAGNDIYVDGNAFINNAISNSTMLLHMTSFGDTLSGTGGIPQLEIDDSTLNVGNITVVNNINLNSGGLTNNGTLTTSADFVFQASDLECINNGTITAGDDIYFNFDRCTLTNNGDVTASDDLFMNTGDNDNKIINNAGHTFTINDDININNSNITIENYGTFNLNDQFRNGEIDGGSNFYNYAGATWNYGGDIYDNSTRIFTNYANSTFNYNRTGNQNIIDPQDAYWNLTLSNSGSKISQADLDVNGNILIDGTADLDVDVNGNDIYLDGNWTDNSTFTEGTQTVFLTGTTIQNISSAAGETFYNLTIDNSGSGILLNTGDITISGTLTMITGNIDAGTNVVNLGTSLTNTGVLSHTSGTIIGKFRRWLNTGGRFYLYPVGTSTNENFATFYPTNLTGGSLTVEFLSGDPGSSGLPLSDAGTTVTNQFTDGYWDFTAADALATTDFNIQLYANGFTSFLVNGDTRILKRINSGNWSFDGTHVIGTPPIVKRSNLTGGISTLGTQFGLGYVACTAITLSSNISDVSCNGGSDGAIDLVVTGGTAPFSYSWSNGGTTEDISGLTAGTYSVTVVDATSCLVTDSYTVQEPAALSVTASVTDVDCNGNANGAIDLTVTGGTTPYTFSWDNGATSEDISGLTAGSYTVTITDAHSCVQTATYAVSEPTALSVISSITDVSCNGGNNGAIDITVSGGTTPYTFSWSNGATSEDLSGLSGGSYTVNITDANGCTTSATYTVNEPAALSVTASVANISCNGAGNGAINITVTGGTTPYTFLWSNGQTSEDLSSIPAGEYTVLVTDANGCQKDTSFSVTEPEAIVITATITDVMCHGENNGIIDVTVSGGISPYTYNWSTGEATEDLSGLSAGSYTLNVTDGNGCRESSSFTISEPDSLSLSASVTDAVCHGDNNGSIDLSVTGGTSPYSFVWDNGATSEDISGLTAGTYKVAVSDANACHSNISVTVSEPDQLTVSSTITDAECPDMPDGSIQLSADGGTSPYNFTWSNGMSGDNIDHLTAGSYSVTVIDMNQCSLDTTFTVGFSRTSCLDIPTVITPNGDGHNDTWRIRNIELYPHVRIEIFTRWGKLVFHSEEGYPNPWDGRYKGKLLPMDSYHYIIDLGNGSSPITGNITIVR